MRFKMNILLLIFSEQGILLSRIAILQKRNSEDLLILYWYLNILVIN